MRIKIMGVELNVYKLLKETNERRINELYRKIQSNKCKIDSLNVRRSNFSACSGLLDLIYANAKEIIKKNKDLLKLIAETLLEYETLTKEQIENKKILLFFKSFFFKSHEKENLVEV